MTFMHKLSYRLALLKDRLPIAVVMLLAMATVFACERPVAVTGPGGGTISHLVISPKTLTLHPNATADFTAVAFLDTGDSASVTVSWSVTSGTMVDTSSNGKRHYGHYKGGQNPGQYAVVATGNPGNVSDTAIVTVTPVPVAALNVAPAAATIAVGATIQLVATTIDSAGNVLTGRSVNWASGNSGAASVDGNGLVTGMGAGAATITATSEGKSGTASVTVSSIPVASVTVSPASASLTVGQTAQFSATPRDANGNALAGRPVTWTSSDGTIASVSASGRATGVAAGGPVTITATSEGQSGAATVTVANAPVASVTVAPATASVATGQTVQLSATPTDANGNPLTGRVITWASSDNTIASVNGSGLVTGVAAGGPVTITATSEGKSGTASITVTAPVATVTVSPAPASVQAGQTQQLTATLKDANGNILTGRTVTWSSNNTTVATVNGSGLVTAKTAGSATIMATSEGKSGTAGITVTPVPVATVTVAPATASVATGQMVQLSATPKDASGNPLTGRVITWTSSDNTIASVNGSGLVRGVAAGGPVTITATSEGKSGTASITVRTASSGPLPVFPGAMGFGTTTAAGRGGAILRVTNLNDAGAGSLRAALEATGPRTVIFEVGGMIDLSDDIYITSPYLTVAGQTAPSPGITLRYAGLQIQTHDVLVQHLRIRVGDLVTPSSLGQRDGIQIQNQNTPPYNVVIDHVSLSWNTDKNMSTWYALHDVTISHSIIAEPLWDARGQNYNLLIGDYSTNVTVLGNMFAHSDERNPYAKGATGTVVVNNLLYDPGQDAITFSDYDGSGPLTSSTVGNVMIAGPSTTDPWIVSIVSPIPSGTAVYLADDVGPALLYESSNIGFEPVVTTPPVSLAGLTILPSSQVEAWVRATAGARPADRDAVDLRLFTEEQTHTGQLRNSQTDVGGWPVLTPTTRALTLPANPNGIDPATGYTNLELWLFQYAAQVEGR